MMELVIAIYLHTQLLAVIHRGPFKHEEDACMKRGDQIVDLLIKRRKPHKKSERLRFTWQCTETVTRLASEERLP